MSAWIPSSACTVGSCVEVRHVDGHVEVRDNTAPDTVLHITPADWAAFLVGAKAGEFDGPAADVDWLARFRAAAEAADNQGWAGTAANLYDLASQLSPNDEDDSDAVIEAIGRALLGIDTAPDES